MNSKNLMIAIAFTMSGSIGLVYEVIWQRKLALIFGTTLPAITAVLAAFMGGLALGSFVFGKFADYSPFPLRWYGFLEVGIGLYCFIMPILFGFADTVHLFAFRHYGENFYVESLRFILAIIILMIPCSFMGGTLPILSKFLIRSQNELGQKLSQLYFLNTIGAVFGTLLAGFLFIRLWGMNRTTIIAALCNIIIGVTFIVFSALTKNGPIIIRSENPAHIVERYRWLPGIYAVLGAAAMGSEIAWTRVLNLIIGSTVYAFTMMLAAFLLGIAVGSLVIGKWLDRVKSPLTLVGALGVICGICIGLSIAIVSRLPVLLLLLFPIFHESFFLWQMCLFGLGFIAIFPATFFMGALFPTIAKAYIDKLGSVGEKVGNLYLWNTLGGIIGSCITGFIFVPFLGSRNSLMLFSLVFLIIGLGILLHHIIEPRIRRQIFILSIISLTMFGLLPNWESSLFDSGVYIYAPQLMDGFEKNRKILFEDEGFHSYVTVTEKSGIRSLRINGKTDGSDGGDLDTQILLAHLPILHHKNPKTALIIGLGTGVTLGSSITYPELHVDCIEIDDGVIEASSYFNHISGNPLATTRANLIQADARTVLATVDKRYDVIISEPSNPWITGVSNLFTLEHFQYCREKLTSNGIMCQWIHSYYMDKQILLTLFQTFQEVFPECSLWAGSYGDYLIIGSQYEVLSDIGHITRMFENVEVANDLQKISITNPENIIDRKVLSPNEFRKMTASYPKNINTDDYPYVEFFAPESLYQDTVSENKEMITSFQD